MAKAQSPVPRGFHTITPQLTFDNAVKAIDWYKQALGAEEVSRFEGPDGRIMHAEIKIGDSHIMMGDEVPEYGARGPGLLGGTSTSFFIYGPDVDARWKRAVDAGGKVTMPLADQFWGDRSGCVEDPFGHQWWISQRMKDMTPDELRKAADAFFEQAASA